MTSGGMNRRQPRAVFGECLVGTIIMLCKVLCSWTRFSRQLQAAAYQELANYNAPAQAELTADRLRPALPPATHRPARAAAMETIRNLFTTPAVAAEAAPAAETPPAPATEPHIADDARSYRT